MDMLLSVLDQFPISEGQSGADSDDEAQRLATSSRLTLTLLRRGRLIPVPPPGKAIEFLEREGRATNGSLPGRRGIIGSPATVRAALEHLAAGYGADEVIVVTITHDHAARRRSYELLAETMELEPHASEGRPVSRTHPRGGR